MGNSRKFKSSYIFSCVGAIALATLFFNYRNNPGADIEIGRNHVIEGTGNNLLGAFASVFYSHIPNLLLPWQVSLLFLQVTLSALGLVLLVWRSELKLTPLSLILGLPLVNILLMFSAEQSRDGTMLAFLTLSTGIGIYALKETVVYKRRILLLISALAFVVGFSFRPWLTFATIPLLYYVIKNVRFNPRIIAISVLLAFLPIGIENLVTRAERLDNWFPQQTVMIHDLSSTYCWSNESEIRERAWDGLSGLINNDSAKTELCQAFKPNTWQSVVGAGSTTLSGIPPLRTIESNNYNEYSKLASAWLKIILSDPFGYIQNHLMLSTQVLIAGETRNISILSLDKTNLYSGLKAIWLLPTEIVKSFHLASPFAIFIFYLFIRQKYLRIRSQNELSDTFLGVLIFWVIITSIGYVSDNGRYTLVPALLLVLISLKELIPQSRPNNGG